MSVSSLIAQAVQIPGYTNPLTYDHEHSLPYHYWICKVCQSSFYGVGDPLHKKSCPVKVQAPHNYRHPALIRVFGPLCCPFSQEELQRIQEISLVNLFKAVV